MFRSNVERFEASVTPPNRRPCIHDSVGPFSISVGFHPKTGAPCEVFIDKRGKIGQGLDSALYDLGVKISKIMQGE